VNEHLTAAQFREISKPVKKPRARPEYDLQCAVVAYVNRVWPENMMYHPANGEHRNKATAARLKRSGVRRGVPDLCVPYGGGRHFYMELKSPKGRVSKAQHAYIEQLRRWGHTVAIIRSIDDVRNSFRALGIITKESV
jgi:hypothetical protein